MIVPLIAALLFYFGPAIGFVAGDRATQLENRKLTDFPAIGSGWSFIPQFQLWANDYLPLRGEAIALGTKFSEKVFNEPPNYGQSTDKGVGVGGAGGGAAQTSAPPADKTETTTDVKYPQVIQGKDGWLFFGADVANNCPPSLSVANVVSNLQRISDAITKSGRKLVLAFAPDKTTIMQQYLPDEFAGKKCMQDAKSAFWQAVSTLKGVSIVDPRAALEDLTKTWDEPAYRKTDTHWVPRGAVAFAELLAAQLDPALAQKTTFAVTGSATTKGDLSGLLGIDREDTVKRIELKRAGVTMTADGVQLGPNDVPHLDYQYRTVTSTSVDATLYPGKTYLYGDSFFEASRNMVAPYFSSLSYIHSQAFEPPDNIVSLANSMVDSDTVIIEVVERSLVSGAAAILKDKVVAAVETAMAANPK